MMNSYLTRNLLVAGIAIILFHGCDLFEEPEPVKLPVLTTSPITEITQTSAKGGGNVTSDNRMKMTACGVCWSLKPNPTITDSITVDAYDIGEYSSSLRNLLPNTTYYVRAYASNCNGTAYGTQISFSTLNAAIPMLKTNTPTKIDNTSAAISAAFTLSGGLPILSKGFCWSDSINPTISNHKIEAIADGFAVNILNLKSGATYYVRAYATNSIGTGYGNEIKVTTTIMDVEGNTYHAIKIGTQTWMVENLRTKKFRDGTAIPNITDLSWVYLSTAAWCNYSDNASFGTKYGHLYNWHAVNDSVHKLAPVGWHIPTDKEWIILVDYLGGASIAGGKLKETGTASWNSPNTGATNETGFTAMAGGLTYLLYSNMGAEGDWWTSTEVSVGSEKAWFRSMFWNNESVGRTDEDKTFGFSVRCVRDN